MDAYRPALPVAHRGHDAGLHVDDSGDVVGGFGGAGPPVWFEHLLDRAEAAELRESLRVRRVELVDEMGGQVGVRTRVMEFAERVADAGDAGSVVDHGRTRVTGVTGVTGLQVCSLRVWAQR